MSSIALNTTASILHLIRWVNDSVCFVQKHKKLCMFSVKKYILIV